MSLSGTEDPGLSSVDDHLMLGFAGDLIPQWLRAVLAERPPAGLTISRLYNVESASEMRALTEQIEKESSAELPLLLAADHETGQLFGMGAGSTRFPGNMALGAVGDAELAERVGLAMGQELRACGITLNYAPVCDVATDPTNPSLGIRAFSDDPNQVALLAAATTRGIQQAGVAATAKHFPGKGEAVVDPHYELPVLDLDRARLDEVELPPFVAAIEAGAKLVMSGHYALPAITDRRDLPGTFSEAVITGLLRQELGFDGVVVTDALDMGAAAQGDVGVDVAAAMAAGVDLLLLARDPDWHEEVRRRLGDGGLPEQLLKASRQRVLGLRRWVAGFEPPDFDVVGSSAHQSLAADVARRSITLVRNDQDLLPLRVDADDRILAVMPAPAALTPADTSGLEVPLLASSLRAHHSRVTEIVTNPNPSTSAIRSARESAQDHDVLIVGTNSATAEQAELATALLDTGLPTVTVALRTPFDLATYPTATTHLCTYSILEPSMDALASALFGRLPVTGRLPVAIPGLYPRGHRLQRP